MAKVLLGISNGLKINDTYIASGFMEQIIEALKKHGNEVLVYIPNNFHKFVFSSDNSLSDDINENDLRQKIKDFSPDLVITFNNAIYHKILEITDCPIVIWGADKEFLWNQKSLIKQNVGRYTFFCFSEQEIKPRQELFNIPNNKIHLMRTATNLHAQDLEQNKNISFIGTCFSGSWLFGNYVTKHSGKQELKSLIEKIKKSLFAGVPFDAQTLVQDKQLLNDFLAIGQEEYYSFFSAERRYQTLLNIADLGLSVYGNGEWLNNARLFPTLAACFDHTRIVTAQ